jgi:ribose/xylose/arabinose/galactoside ABC-type transport system permease subunit
LLAKRSHRGRQPWLILVAIVIALLVMPSLLGGPLNTFTAYTILQAFADFGLVTLGLGLTMVIAEYDLSTTAVYALSGLLAVKFGEHSALLGVAAAVAVGAFVGAAQGGIMATLGISSVPVTLGGYLILSGATSAVSGGQPVPYTNINLGVDLNQQILTVFSPRSLIVLALFVVAAAIMRLTRLGRDVRALGGDRRSSRTAGVRVQRTVIGVMVTSGACCGLGGALSAISVAAGPSDVTVTPLIYATIGAILGGVTLAGGRGTPIGMAAGALSLATLNQTLAIVGAADYVSAIVTAVLLLLATVLTAPDLARSALGRYIRRLKRAAPIESGGAVRQ